MPSRTPGQDQAIRQRALAKSLDEVRANNLPALVEQTESTQVWSVTSRTRERTVHLVTLTRYGEIGCSCEAGLHGGHCWHLTHVQRALDGAIGFHPLPVRRFA